MRRIAAAVAALLMGAASLGAQTTPTVLVTGPAGNPITDGIVTFTVNAVNFQPEDFPLRIQLQVATSPAFDAPLFADTTVAGPAATITIPRLVPAGAQLFWRAFALTARAGSVPSGVTGPRATPSTHLRLVTPNNPAGQSLNTRTPKFVWSASHIPPSFGAWDFELRVEETATGQVVLLANTPDTTVTSAVDLEANTSYRWRVTSRLRSTGDTFTAVSAGTFVVLSTDAPFTTVLYDPFPSPFPTAAIDRACIWFDISEPATVRLMILDLRGLLVRQILPPSNTPFPRGRFGRPQSGIPGGCDNTYSWDGTDRNGQRVQPGVYIIVLQAGSQTFKRRVVLQR